MLKVYKNLISQNTADSIYHSLMSFIINDSQHYFEFSNSATNNKSWGYMNLPETYLEIDRIKSFVEKDFGDEYEFTHTYSRIYPAGGILNPHIDREGLDLTLTLNVHSDVNNPWPILFSKKTFDTVLNDIHIYTVGDSESYELFKEYTKDFESVILNEGDGACCTRDVPHWREPFNVKFEATQWR